MNPAIDFAVRTSLIATATFFLLWWVGTLALLARAAWRTWRGTGG